VQALTIRAAGRGREASECGPRPGTEFDPL